MSRTTEPVPIHTLAEHMRDDAWLDMRVIGRGTLERVRIAELRIRRDNEKVVVEQAAVHVNGTIPGRRKMDPDSTLKYISQAVDCEDIRWVRPTVFGIWDCTPIARPDKDVPGGLGLDERARTILTNAVKVDRGIDPGNPVYVIDQDGNSVIQGRTMPEMLADPGPPKRFSPMGSPWDARTAKAKASILDAVSELYEDGDKGRQTVASVLLHQVCNLTADQVGEAFGMGAGLHNDGFLREAYRQLSDSKMGCGVLHANFYACMAVVRSNVPGGRTAPFDVGYWIG